MKLHQPKRKRERPPSMFPGRISSPARVPDLTGTGDTSCKTCLTMGHCLRRPSLQHRVSHHTFMSALMFQSYLPWDTGKSVGFRQWEYSKGCLLQHHVLSNAHTSCTCKQAKLRHRSHSDASTSFDLITNFHIMTFCLSIPHDKFP